MHRLQRKTEKNSGHSTSLFGEILDWLLAPLLFLWPISIVFTYNIAGNIADRPYDRDLAESLNTLAEMVEPASREVKLNFAAPPRLLFRSDEDDVLYYQIATEDGVVSGDAEIPWFHPYEEDGGNSGEILFRDDLIKGEEVRIASLFLETEDGAPVLVQLAETRNKRIALTSSMLTGVLVPQLLIIPLSIVLVWIGLSQGLLPLSRLRDHILRRRPSDMSPVPPSSVPDEVQPLVSAYNRMMEKLAANQKAQRRFIADAAHQMRTPMTGLKTQTELAREETDPVLLVKSLDHIALSVDRANHLINQLLSLARAESSTENLYTIEKLDLNTIAFCAAETFFPGALAKQIDLGAEVWPAPIWITGNEMLLQEMLKNLLSNALKYTPQKGSITIRTYLLGPQPVCEIEDSGIGIAESERQRVFERFYRVLGNNEPGSGLGLAIVREIAEWHQAAISLDTARSGHGTAAKIIFPADTDRSAAYAEIAKKQKQ